VRDNQESRTYEARVGDTEVGTLIYEVEGHRIVLTHTIVEPDYREHGVGTALVRSALDDIRAKGAKITVLCSFVGDFIRDHPEYADLVDAEHPGHALSR
jgi:predicted GNAT family acetyltransferase